MGTSHLRRPHGRRAIRVCRPLGETRRRAAAALVSDRFIWRWSADGTYSASSVIGMSSLLGPKNYGHYRLHRKSSSSSGWLCINGFGQQSAGHGTDCRTPLRATSVIRKMKLWITCLPTALSPESFGISCCSPAAGATRARRSLSSVGLVDARPGCHAVAAEERTRLHSSPRVVVYLERTECYGLRWQVLHGVAAGWEGDAGHGRVDFGGLHHGHRVLGASCSSLVCHLP